MGHGSRRWCTRYCHPTSSLLNSHQAQFWTKANCQSDMSNVPTFNTWSPSCHSPSCHSPFVALSYCWTICQQSIDFLLSNSYILHPCELWPSLAIVGIIRYNMPQPLNLWTFTQDVKLQLKGWWNYSWKTEGLEDVLFVFPLIKWTLASYQVIRALILCCCNLFRDG